MCFKVTCHHRTQLHRGRCHVRGKAEPASAGLYRPLCYCQKGPLELPMAFLCTYSRQLENNVSLPIRKKEFNGGGVYSNCNADRCFSGVHGSPDIVQTVGKDRRWSAWGQTCCLAELEAGLTGCGLWSLSPCKVTGSQRDMRHLKGGSLLLPDRLLCLQVAFVTRATGWHSRSSLAPALCTCLSVRSWPRPGWQGSLSHPANIPKKTRTVTT